MVKMTEEAHRAGLAASNALLEDRQIHSRMHLPIARIRSMMGRPSTTEELALVSDAIAETLQFSDVPKGVAQVYRDVAAEYVKGAYEAVGMRSPQPTSQGTNQDKPDRESVIKWAVDEAVGKKVWSVSQTRRQEIADEEREKIQESKISENPDYLGRLTRRYEKSQREKALDRWAGL